jgi:predicted ester cyclase
MNLEERARKVFEIVDSQHPEELPEYVHEDVAMDFLGVKFDGLAAVTEMLRGLYAAIPDQEHRIDNLIVDEPNQKVALQSRMGGTHEGPFETVLGPIGGRGQTIGWGSGTFLGFRDGKVAVWDVYLDQVTVLNELGVATADVFDQGGAGS